MTHGAGADVDASVAGAVAAADAGAAVTAQLAHRYDDSRNEDQDDWDSAADQETQVNSATEQTPLLGPAVGDSARRPNSTASSHNGPSHKGLSDDPDKPLPKGQILLLCYVRFLEPIAMFSIFAYIAEMVQVNGHLADENLGFYSGLIESLFSAAQMLVLMFWGRLADRIGRKPVLLCCLVGLAVTTVLFGLSKTIWQMILIRCLAGIFSGTNLIIRTMIAEHSTAKTQATAYSWFSVGGNVGIFLGPLLGGALANPARQYPSVFGGMSFFEQYPYALPGFVNGLINCSGLVLCVLYLKETLVREDKDGEASVNPGSQPISTWDLLKVPNVARVIWTYQHVMFLAFSFTAIIPICLFTPIRLGGYGFSPLKISIFFAIGGLGQALWLLVAFPFLQHRLGSKGVTLWCSYVYPFFFLTKIILSYLLRDGSETAIIWFWILLAIDTTVGPGVSLAFTSSQLLINEAAPTTRVLGTLNALALTIASGVRAVTPAASTSIYAIGLHNQHILGGHLAWVILAVIAALLFPIVRALPNDKPPASEGNNDDDA